MNGYFTSFIILAAGAFSTFSQTNGEWTIVVPSESLKEEAVKVAIEDLQKTGEALGLLFRVSADTSKHPAHAILLGAPTRNRLTAELKKQGAIDLAGVNNTEGYEITTATGNGGKTIVVSGGSVPGDVYGLYWVRDRLRVYRSMPDINVKREPKLRIRYTRVAVNSKEDIRRALRYGLNLVFVRDVLNFVPWNVEPEQSENEKNRARAMELVRYAHSLHLKCVAFGTDFTYHPSLLDEFDASLSPSDPRFWDAVKAKYRRLLQAMPELDGVATFTGPEQSYWGNYKTFDPMHGGEGCDWSLAKRYRTFIKYVWSVVSGEFDRILMHRTWTTSAYEQQSQPEVYRSIFTDDVPVKNLYLIPSFTQNDRWWHQRYNPTLNQTPHNMMVVFESMDYHAGGNLFPTYPGPYYQCGLQTMLDVNDSNLKGCSLDLPGGDGWDTRNLTAYTVSRLSWDHHEDVRRIAEDFASIHFGPAAAEAMAEIFLLSPVAYKYGLYVEPVAYGEFNSLPHIRVGMFVADGYPSIDNGKVHLEFLRKIYLRCKPWIFETLQDLDHGLETAVSMTRSFRSLKPSLADPVQAGLVENALELTRLLILTNNLYVRTCFAFFRYREDPTTANKARLRELCGELETTCKTFSETPGFRYQLFGVKQLVKNCSQVLNNLEEAEKRFASAPDIETIERSIMEEREKYRRILAEYSGDAVHLGHWVCKVDGRDLIRIRGDKVETEHLRWDGMTVAESTIVNPLPAGEGTVIPRSIASRPMHPFILEQPSPENNYTVTVYLNDVPGGSDWWKFDLFYIDRPHRELGLNTAW